MAYKKLNVCPVCSNELEITRLECNCCNTKIEGNFSSCEFCSLSDDESYFLKVFIKCRGNIKEVEKELQISYPTVKGKLNQLIQSLGLEDNAAEELKRKERKEEILALLDAGVISPQEAITELDKLK